MSTLQNLLSQADSIRQTIPAPCSLKEIAAAEGRSGAAGYMLELAGRKNLDITEDMIRELHRLLFQKEGAARPGEYRKIQVSPDTADHIPPQPEEVPRLMKHFADQIHFSRSTLHPIELAAMAHKRLVDIHPFTEGNKETALLLMNLLLVNAGYGPVSISPGAENDYEKALSASRRLNDMEPFSILIAQWVIGA